MKDGKLSSDQLGPAKSAILLPTPFSNLQWYMHRSRNIVSFVAERHEDLTESELERLTNCLLDSAPYLCFRAEQNKQHVQMDVPTKDVCQFERTTSLKDSLLKTLQNPNAVYDDLKLPNLRAFGFQLESPREGQAKSMIVFLATHALMEGAEASRIVRGRQEFEEENRPAAPLSLAVRTAVWIGSKILGSLHLCASAFNKGYQDTEHIAIFDLDRSDVRKLSKRLKVRQRSLLFSLPLHGLRPDTGNTKKSPKPQTVGYSMLPKNKEKIGDAALKFRMQIGRFPSTNRFEDCVRAADAVLDQEDIAEAFGPALYDSILKFHRKLSALFPCFYGKRFFSFVPYDFLLSLVPPHISTGPLRNDLTGSIFCNSNSPGGNCCVIVPHRTGFSLNLSLDRDTHARVGAMTALLDQSKISYRRVL